MPDIDDMIADDEAGYKEEAKPQDKPIEYIFPPTTSIENPENQSNEHEEPQKVLVGKVEHFFEKINVAAVQLTGNLRIGDVIEIENANEEAVRLQVSSMQINKQNVEEAYDGDSVGIKVNRPINAGSNVYVMNIELEDFRQ
jgi:translation elongation factor EF-1alpha